MKKELELLKELTQLFAPSGYEDEVRNYLLKKYQELGYKTEIDPFGNTYAIKKSKKENAKKVLLIGHMDEVGFMVKKILPNGSLNVMPLGGFNSETILASRAILKTFNGQTYYGAVASVPPHLLKNAKNEKTPIDSMVFDFGFTTFQEAVDAGIEISNPIVLEGKFEMLSSRKRMLSKAFDDRFGLALGLEVLNHYKDVELDFDLYVGGVLQEEVGLRGSSCAVNYVHPDFAIVADCSTAMDTDGSKEFGILGKGVLLRVMDPSMIARKEIIAFQKECFDKNNVPYQYFIAAGSTDAGAVHKALGGIPTLSYCLVARNIHTCSSILDVEDYLNSIKGIFSIIDNLSENRIKAFKYEQ